MAVLGLHIIRANNTLPAASNFVFLHFCSYLYGKCNTFIAIKQIKLKHFRFVVILAPKYHFVAHPDWHIKQLQ